MCLLLHGQTTKWLPLHCFDIGLFSVFNPELQSSGLIIIRFYINPSPWHYTCARATFLVRKIAGESILGVFMT